MIADPMVIAAAAVIIIAAFAAGVVSIINALGNMKKELLVGQSKVEVKADEIHTLVDGSATKAAEKLTSLETQLAALHTEITRLQEQRVEDAKTRAAGDK